MTFVPADQAAQHAERLLKIVNELGGKPAALEGLEAGVVSLWAILESLASPGNPTDATVTDNRLQECSSKTA